MTSSHAPSLEHKRLVAVMLLVQALFAAGFWLGTPPGAAAALILSAAVVRLIWRGEPFPFRLVLSREVFWAFLGVFAASSFVLLAVDYFSVEFAIFDTGIFANATYNYFRTGNYYSSVLQAPALRDHFTPILAALSPLYRVYNSFLLLPILKTLAFYSCPVILLIFARRLLPPKHPCIYLLPLLWLVNVHLMKVLTMEFQPSSLALPIVLAAFLFAWEERWPLMLFSLGTLLLFKENMAIVWLSVGLFVALERKRVFPGGALAAAGISVGLAVFFWIIPLVGGGPSFHMSRFGPVDLVGQKVLLVAQGILSVGVLPLLAPRTLLYILPAFALTLISRDPLMVSFGFHYQDVPLAVLFVGALIGMRDAIGSGWWNRLSPLRQSHVVLVLISVLMLLHSKTVIGRIWRNWPTNEDIRVIAAVEQARESVGLRSNVWAEDSIGPYFFNHPGLRCITDNAGPIKDENSKAIVTSSSVSHWPLSDEQYKEFRKSLDLLASEGKLERKAFGTLHLYLSP